MQNRKDLYLQNRKVVKLDSFEPSQQKTNKRFKIVADVYEQQFLKFPEIATFHSYHELLYAGLLEENSKVTSFTPQPYQFMIGKRRYTPDFFYIKNGKKYVIEIKPNGELKDEIFYPIFEFLSKENIKFKVISNEEIKEKEQLAQNWLSLIRILKSAEHIDTTGIELSILEQCSFENNNKISDFIDISRRNEDLKKEIAIYRLAHSGKIKLKLSKKPLNYDTGVKVCA